MMPGGTSDLISRAAFVRGTHGLPIRTLYRLNDRRLAAERDSAAFRAADDGLRRAVAAMETRRETELAGVALATPCRKVLESLDGHREGLTRFVDDPRIPLDNSASERCDRGAAVARKDFYGSGAAWSGRRAAGGTVAVEAQSPELADVVLRALRGSRGAGPGGHPTVLAVPL